MGTPHPADESYADVEANPFRRSTRDPLSTFSIDVDTASYSNVRRFLQDDRLPPVAAVRVEEMINYFDYDYPAPELGSPIRVHTELGPCPWREGHELLLVGLQAEHVEPAHAPDCNLVFLVDVSGSMSDDDKLPLAQRALRRLTQSLDSNDSIAIVTYAGSSSIALRPTDADDRRIPRVIDSLAAGGATNGADGIRDAYELARRRFDPDGVNRVVLVTDGDFNVGTTSQPELRDLIEEERSSGVYLTVVGVGTGNLQDDRMEMLAAHGNGHYVYLDSSLEARKAFQRELTSNLVTVADDVKIQVEFNPETVRSYRLIGYDNRALEAQDFSDDSTDAGELGAGRSVTALYEIVPGHGSIERLRYQPSRESAPHGEFGDEYCQVKVRYKRPGHRTSQRIVTIVSAEETPRASHRSTFASSIAAFGMSLRNSPFRGESDYALALELGRASRGRDPHGDRSELLRLIQTAEELDPRGDRSASK